MKPLIKLPHVLIRLLLAGCLLLASLALLPLGGTARAIECVFLNPLLPAGQDPSVVYHDGAYYLVQSIANGLTIAKSDTITGLSTSDPVLVYSPPPGQPYSTSLWAPDLAYLDGHWYIYVAAADPTGNNATHRMYVLQADTDDPLGTWTMQGKVYDPTADRWAIDGTVFEYHDKFYMVWSGWPTEKGDIPQNLYIAEMSDPLALAGPRHLLSEPDQPWEKTIRAFEEGPQAFIHDDRLSIVYSADASWTAAYKLGMLTLTGSDPLDRASWTKVGPVFQQVDDPEAPVYGPGHSSSPVPSPDGTETWFLYHAKANRADGWDDRNIRAQEIEWAVDGTPILGKPIPASQAQDVPAGEPCGLVTRFDDPAIDDPAAAPEGFLDTGQAWLNTRQSFSITADVALSEADSAQAFVSQEGGITSNFVLGYQDGRFAFTLYDGFGRSAFAATSTAQPEIGRWYHLAGVYDAEADKVRLYVDGELQGTAAFDQPWEAAGDTLIGAALHRSKRADLFTGDIRNVQLFSGALSQAEVQEMGLAVPQ